MPAKGQGWVMNVRPAWLRPRYASGLVNLSPSTAETETFTVIHYGAEIDESRAGELVEAVSAWAAAAEAGVTRAVEIWGPPWRLLLPGCVATAAAAGGSLSIMSLYGADDLISALKARGVPVRYRQARQSLVVDAELRAVCRGWPLRYM
jgi:hypothetical protein